MDCLVRVSDERGEVRGAAAIEATRCKLIDFGLCKSAGTQSGPAGGTIPYMSPGCCSGMPPDPSDDLYSLGILLTYALLHEFPCASSASDSRSRRAEIRLMHMDGHAHRRAHALFQERDSQGCDQLFLEFVLSLLEKDAAQRPSASQAVHLLQDLVSRMRSNVADASAPRSDQSGALPGDVSVSDAVAFFCNFPGLAKPLLRNAPVLFLAALCGFSDCECVNQFFSKPHELCLFCFLWLPSAMNLLIATSTRLMLTDATVCAYSFAICIQDAN